MIKLVRNNWGRCKVFRNAAGDDIKFEYIVKLFNIQEEEFVRFGNKLRKSHMEWRKQAMKVNIFTFNHY